jgi:hypothetical protein
MPAISVRHPAELVWLLPSQRHTHTLCPSHLTRGLGLRPQHIQHCLPLRPRPRHLVAEAAMARCSGFVPKKHEIRTRTDQEGVSARTIKPLVRNKDRDGYYGALSGEHDKSFRLGPSHGSCLRYHTAGISKRTTTRVHCLSSA